MLVDSNMIRELGRGKRREVRGGGQKWGWAAGIETHRRLSLPPTLLDKLGHCPAPLHFPGLAHTPFLSRMRGSWIRLCFNGRARKSVRRRMVVTLRRASLGAAFVVPNRGKPNMCRFASHGWRASNRILGRHEASGCPASSRTGLHRVAPKDGSWESQPPLPSRSRGRLQLLWSVQPCY